MAEALLWKMGKWTAYKNFVRHYQSEEKLTSTGDVVFAAFTRHLRDSSNPIYDQHALRAMWAINSRLSTAEQLMCRKALFKSKGPVEVQTRSDSYRIFRV